MALRSVDIGTAAKIGRDVWLGATLEPLLGGRWHSLKPWPAVYCAGLADTKSVHA